MDGGEDSGRGLLLSGAVGLLALATFASLRGFQLLLSVVPLYADASGGGSSGAGSMTAAFMLSTVMIQVNMPGLLAQENRVWGIRAGSGIMLAEERGARAGDGQLA